MTYIKVKFYAAPHVYYADANGEAYVGGFFIESILSVVGFTLDKSGRQATQLQISDGSTVIALKPVTEIVDELKAARVDNRPEIDWTAVTHDSTSIDAIYEREENAIREQERARRNSRNDLQGGRKKGGLGGIFGR